jgi:hypothetical protein
VNRYLAVKQTNPVKAIREMCIECMGGRDNERSHKKLIAECATTVCALYEYRFGKNPYHRQNLSKEQRKVLADRASNSTLIRRAVGKSRPNLDDIDLVDTE